MAPSLQTRKELSLTLNRQYVHQSVAYGPTCTTVAKYTEHGLDKAYPHRTSRQYRGVHVLEFASLKGG